jgi:hypothetical protein
MEAEVKAKAAQGVEAEVAGPLGKAAAVADDGARNVVPTAPTMWFSAETEAGAEPEALKVEKERALLLRRRE